MNATFYSPTSWLSTRLRSRLATLAAGLLLAPAAAWAQAPANDNCSGAIALTPGTTCTATAATNLNATASTGVPAPGSSCFLAGTAINNDVWYSIVVPSTGAVTVTTSASTGSSLNDTGLVLYSGTCTALTEVGCSDDITTANTFSSATATGLTAGSTIYARVWSFGSTPTGAFGICAVTAAAPPPGPANDNCAGAIALTAGTTCTVTTATNVSATASGLTPVCGGSSASNDVWYSIVVPAGGGVTVTTSAITGSTFTDSVLELFSGTCTSLTNIGCNDDATGNYSSVTARGLTVGSTIYARVFSYGSTPTGQFGICATIPAAGAINDDPSGAIVLPIAATCTPLNGTNAAATTTTANGYVNPGVAPNACGIAVSPKDVWYSFTTPASGAGSTAVTIQVTGAPAGYIRLFSAASAAGPFTELACASGGANNTVSAPLTSLSLTPNTTYYVSVAGYGSADTQGAFTICAVAVPANDASVQGIYALGSISNTYSSPVTVQAVIRNAGSSALTNLPVTLVVTGATVATDIKLIPTLAVGASATVTFTAFPVTAASGTNTLTVTVPADGVATNNSRTFSQTITPATLSYTSGTTFETGGVGVAATNSVVAIRYQTSGPASVRSVTPSFAAASAGGSYQIQIYSAGATAPGTLLYTSPTQTRTTAASSPTITLPGVNVNGPFYVGILNLGTTNLAIAYQLENPLRPGTFLYTSTGGTTWVDISTSTLNSRLAVDVALGAPLSNKDAIGAGTLSVFPNPAHQDFTLRLPAIAGQRTAQLTLINTLGQQVQSRTIQLSAAGTDTQMDVSNLAKGIYTLRVQTADQVATKQISVE